MNNFRDIEQLSSYLDGQLSPTESARVKSRLSSDPGLASAFNDIRAARGILRKLPARKAPRNFTLTRQMVGLKPPLPQSYSFFRFSTAFAAFLFMLTFAVNALPRISFGASAPVAQEVYGAGGGGAATETPAAIEAPAAVEAPSMEMAIAPTEILPAATADSAREIPTAEAPSPKDAGNESESQNQPQVRNDAVVPIIWQIGLLVIGLVSAVIAFVMSQSARKKWR